MTYLEAALAKRAEIDAANALMSDEEALKNKGAYRSWENLVKYSVSVKAGYRFRHGDKLCKTRQPEYTFVSYYTPGEIGTESLFEVINETHAGTLEDPIPYEGNMELLKGLYYSQGGVTCLCTVGSGQAVFHALSDLVGIYVEVVDNE